MITPSIVQPDVMKISDGTKASEMTQFSLEEIWRQMNELKSKHSDLDVAFKSVLNVESPIKQVSSPKEDSRSGSQVLETS